MAIRLSDAAAALMAGDCGLRRALSGAHMVFYTGTQPTTANDTPGSSQAIIAFTQDDGVYVAETRPVWSGVLSGLAGTAGLSSIVMDNWEILGATVTGTVLDTIGADIATQINDNIAALDFYATYDTGTDTLSIYGPHGVGTSMNSMVLSVTTTGTLTFTHTGGTGAVDTSGVAVANGLTFDAPADGAGLSTPEDVFYITKPSGETWKGKNGFGPATAAATAVFSGIVNGNAYTAGWGRICASSGDDGSSATSGESGYIRLDFSVGTGSADFLMTPTASFTVNTTSGSEIESVINTFRLKIATELG